MIVAAVAILLRPVLMHLSTVWQSRRAVCGCTDGAVLPCGDLRFGVAMTVFLPCLWLGQLIAGASTPAWLGWGIGMFVVGWVFQFVGHYYEGRKPAFDDLSGLIIGPLFVAAEFAFAMGLRKGNAGCRRSQSQPHADPADEARPNPRCHKT